MGHAGELETSLMLHLCPDLVHMERVVDETDFVATPSYYMDWIEGGALIANPRRSGGNCSARSPLPTGCCGDPPMRDTTLVTANAPNDCATPCAANCSVTCRICS